MSPDNVAKVKSYLRGLAAFCSNSLRSQVDRVGRLMNAEIESIRSSRASVSALGRLRVKDPEMVVSNETVRQASSTTVSQLGTGSTGDANQDCLEFMRAIFPDDVDEARFYSTVDQNLYTRMQSMTLSIRIGIQFAVVADPMKDLLVDPARVVRDVAVAGVRIAGAPATACLLYTSPSPRDQRGSRMPSSA